MLMFFLHSIKNRRKRRDRDAGRDLSNIEIPTVSGKQMGDHQQQPQQQHPREGIYSRGPGLVTVPGMANAIAQSHAPHPGTSYGPGREQGYYAGFAPGHGHAHAALPRHGSLPRDAARLHQQGSLPHPGLTRRLSSEEHIYEKTPYDAYSLASGSQSGSIGRTQGTLVNPSPANAMPPIPSPSGTASTNMTFEMEATETKRFQ